MGQVFSKNWFKKHQKGLLWFANSILGKIVFRYGKMGLYKGKHSLERKAPLIKITPNSVAQYVWYQGKIQIREHFFIRPEYALKLRFWFYPLWYAFHAWDILIANNLNPKLNLGFDTLTKNPDTGTGATTVDGYVQRSVAEESWATLIAGAGNIASPLATDNVIIYIGAGTSADKWTDLVRSIFTYDTSSLGSGATITAVVKSIYGSSKGDSATAITPNIDIYAATPAANNNLQNSDYGQIGSTSQTGSPITYASWSTTGYNDFTFNTYANISLTGVTKLGARNANYDVAAVAPTWSAGTTHYLSGLYADNGSNKPKLVITYTPGNVTIISPLATENIQGLVPTLKVYLDSALAALNIQGLVPTLRIYGSAFTAQSKHSSTASNLSKHNSTASNASKHSSTWSNQQKS